MNLKIKYWHQKEPTRHRCTIALDVPSKEDLIKMINDFYLTNDPVVYKGILGVALVHPKDKFYVKKTGVGTAMSAAKSATYTLKGVGKTLDGTVVQFDANNLLHKFQVNFLIKPDTMAIIPQFVNVLQIKRR